MKIEWFGPLLVVSLAVGLAVPAAAQTGAVTGQVRIADTQSPIPGAVVQVITPDGGRVAGALTNQSGRYQISNIAPGSYVVTVTMTGYATGRFENIQVAAGQTAVVNAELVPRAIDLDPVVVSASRRQERALDAPARVEVVNPQLIEERPATQPVDHLRNIAGVDIVTQGVQSTNVVARGFNNIFSGALLALTDHRIAAIPSLRVNALYMVPSTNEDLERMEVVLGPGSALYGPNTANGVLHMFTRSPLTYQGTTATFTAGERGVLQPTFRTAHLVNENLGVKISGQYFQAEEWKFVDDIEEQARLANPGNPRIGQRNFDTERWSVEGRVDWRFLPDATAILSAGRSTTARGVELTGLGAAQIRDWSYDYVQGRFNWRGLFAQAYVNMSSAGDTYLLRDGQDIVDDSRMFVAQIQHAAEATNWQNFVYGIDYLATMPETGRTIHGRFEDEDEFTEVGAFLQSETRLHPMFDLVLAGRVDRHSVIDEVVFSPRAALVFKPVETQTFRVSYNRAYSNPGSVQLFLDLGAGPLAAPLGPLGYAARGTGTGRTGFRFAQEDGSYVMRSPLGGTSTEARTMIRPVTVNNLWQLQVNGMMAAAGAAVAPVFQQLAPLGVTPQQLVAHLYANAPTQIGIASINPLRPTEVVPFQGLADIPGIRESNTTSYEIGYKGILGQRVLLAADFWYNQRDNFISPLIPQTPFVLLDPLAAGTHAGQQIAAFFVPRFIQAGMTQQQALAQAEAIAGQLAPVLAQIPGGVVTSPDFQAGPELLVTYRNFGDVNLWGTDFAVQALLTDQWTLGASVSTVSDDFFETEGQFIALNAPKQKGSASIGYRNEGWGFNGEARVRHMGGFPVQSGVYVGLQCVIPGNQFPCVESHTLADLTLGYRVPQLRGAGLQLTVQNLFDTPYQSFVGVPEVRRMALLRLRYDF